jgi:hypothetical protein
MAVKFEAASTYIQLQTSLITCGCTFSSVASTDILSPTSLITCGCQIQSCLHSHSTRNLFHVYILCSCFTSNWWSIVDEPRSHNSISARHTLFGGTIHSSQRNVEAEDPAEAPLVYSGCSLEMATKSGRSSPSSPLLASSSLENQFLRLIDPRGTSFGIT